LATPSLVTTQALVTFAGYLLDSGRMWSGSTITYSIQTAGSAWPGYGPGSEPFRQGYRVLDAFQANNFRRAVEAWDPAYRGELNETSDLERPGQIRIAFTDAGLAYTRGPPGDPFVPPAEPEQAYHGDIWLPPDMSGTNLGAYEDGRNDLNALVKFVGQALGMRVLRGIGQLPEYNNSRFSVMSTLAASDSLTWHVLETPSGPKVASYVVLPTTPMVLDVFTMEVRYGAPNANPGDTTYTWLEDLPIMMTVVDGGGIDTWDLSAHRRGSIVNLATGSYSSIAFYSQAQQLADLSARYPALAGELATRFSQSNIHYEWSLNVGIAYKSIIENVRGGSGADGIQGNEVSNTLSGGAGDDFLLGVDGNDSLDGGMGADRVFGGTGGDTLADAAGSNYLRGDEGNDSIAGGGDFDDINGNMGDDTGSGGLGDDWVVGGKDHDLLFGDDGADIVYGNLGADTCDGGAGNDVVRGGQENDVVRGGAGDDYVSGDRGDDTVTGGSGADLFHTSGDAGLDRVMDFSLADGDRVMLDPGTQYTVEQVGADTVISMPGGQMILVGVQLSSLPAGWIFGA